MPQATDPLAGHDLRITPVSATIETVSPGVFEHMPLANRIFAENLIRNSEPAQLHGYLEQVVQGRSDCDFPFFPARVILQDLLGTPALVDLAGLREAVAQAGGDPLQVNPVVPTQLVVDHSLNVDVDGMRHDALQQNMAIEQRKNAERFEFLAWARQAFHNVEVVMPGNGILHQINLERLSPVVQVKKGMVFADTLVGTDSHTTMINALGVLGWGVGGIEAESVMLGRPIWLRLPRIVGVEILGSRRPGTQATDLVLALTEFLRSEGVVGCILEFHGSGVSQLSLADRATIANMAPEFGATAAMFAIDEQTLEFLHLTGRMPAQVRLVEAYARTQGLWAESLERVEYSRRLSFDLKGAGRALAGPAQPHQRIPLGRLKKLAPFGTDKPPAETPSSAKGRLCPAAALLPEGAVVIAAITSCTSTSNPHNLIAAGLLAHKAASLGLQRKPWVKTSFAPGSRVAEKYLRSAGLMAPLEALGFGIVGFGCTSCNGMSGPLAAEIENEIVERGLDATAVLSGNRNFKGRIHPRVKSAFLASPALVVACAIAGTIRIDMENEPLAADAQGQPVTLADLWPPDEAIDAVVAEHVRSEQFRSVYEAMFDPPAESRARGVVPPLYPWREESTYISRPPYWQKALTAPPKAREMRALAILGDHVTTDDLSPSGAILADSAAGRYLMDRGTAPADFNSYGTRRGDHRVAVRATFANNRLKNEMVPGVEGSFTRLEPEGVVMPLFEAAQTYLQRGQELVVIAGKNYGCGSSRDWAAKGVRLLGVRAVVAESFERIHRTNLVGMGVLPLEFEAGTTRKTLGIDGSETFTIEGLSETPEPGGTLVLAITRQDGSVRRVPVKCRIDTAEERQIFAAGGLLPHIAGELGRAGPPHPALQTGQRPAPTTQLRIPAVYMRGGTSKGVFFLADDLPSDPAERDRVLLRVIGSPDRFGKHIDGMGGATSSTSKVVVLSRSTRSACDVDYLFGAVAIGRPVIDWSGNCGNLTAAVGPFAISSGLVPAPPRETATVRIWQANIGKRIIAHVPMQNGMVLEEGDFELDGVAFPAAEVKLEFLDPGTAVGEGGAMFPTGARVEWLDVPDVGKIEVTLVNAGLPTIFVEAASLGLRGTELQGEVDGNPALLARAEAIRALGAVAMGLVASAAEATANRPHSPKIAFVAESMTYTASDGKVIAADGIDLLARIFSMGSLHHAMTGTGAVAIAAAAAIPDTLVHRVARTGTAGRVCFGHPSGTLSVGAEAHKADGKWMVSKVLMSRSARRLMEGWVRIPRF